MIASRANQRGSQIVEASLTLSAFLMVTLGVFTFGFAVFVEQSLIHGARSAVRYGAVHAYKDDSQLIPEVRNVALCGNPSSCAGAYGITPSTVTVTCPGAGAPADKTCQTNPRIVVTVPAHPLLSLVPGVGGLSGRSITASLPIENTTGAVE